MSAQSRERPERAEPGEPRKITSNGSCRAGRPHVRLKRPSATPELRPVPTTAEKAFDDGPDRAGDSSAEHRAQPNTGFATAREDAGRKLAAAAKPKARAPRADEPARTETLESRREPSGRAGDERVAGAHQQGEHEVLAR